MKVSKKIGEDNQPDQSKSTPPCYSVRHRKCWSGLPTQSFPSIFVTSAITSLMLESFTKIKEHSSFSIHCLKAVRVHFKCRSI